MTSYFVSEVAKYHRISPKPQNTVRTQLPDSVSDAACCVLYRGRAVADGVIWQRKLTRQMALTTHLLLAGLDDVTRDVTRRQDDRRKLMTFYGVSATSTEISCLPSVYTGVIRYEIDGSWIYEKSARTWQ